MSERKCNYCGGDHIQMPYFIAIKHEALGHAQTSIKRTQIFAEIEDHAWGMDFPILIKAFDCWERMEDSLPVLINHLDRKAELPKNSEKRAA